MALRNFLKQPHPFTYNSVSILLPAGAVFILMLVLAPFGLDKISFTLRFLYALTFGLVGASGVILTVNLLRLLTPEFMREESWTIGKETLLILLVISVICVIIFLIFFLLGIDSENPGGLFLQIVIFTIGISILPVALLVLFEQFVHQRKKLRQARAITTELRSMAVNRARISKETESEEPQKLSIRAENGNSELRIEPHHLAYLKSDGNYVEVFYLNSRNDVQKKLIRNRLKNLESYLPDHTFFRCHKSYLVNRNHITSVDGNARNFELTLAGIEERIPVSRSKSEKLKELLTS